MPGQSGTVDATAVAGTGTGLVRAIRWDPTDEGRRVLAEKEWLVTNGLGGYASGTLSGALTRRYHAYLVAALPTPFGRTVMLNYIWERIRYPDGRLVSLHNMIDTPAGKEFDAAQVADRRSGSKRASPCGPSMSRTSASRSAC